jgi:ADP-heptose:LPS heptosyltransferase
MINYSCRHYRASKPCIFNKTDGSECPTCGHVSEFKERILFIKLDAIGDVLRSASLLPVIRDRHNAPFIAWLTRKESAELVGMMEHVDEVIELSEVGLARVATGGWDCVYSLSNDLPSAAIATSAPVKQARVGYYLQDGIIRPSNDAAERWLDMAAFDRLKRENTQTYQARMLAILGHEGSPAPPALKVDAGLLAQAAAQVSALFPKSQRARLAINIGAGGRWPKKMLDAQQIYHYIRALQRRSEVDIMLVGGASEADKAKAILALCGTDSHIQPVLTPSSIPHFVAVLKQAQTLLCGDTLALHIATAIGLPTVAVFGPTSSAEIADFNGLVAKTWVSQLDCLVCYGDCDKPANCMSLLDVEYLADLTLGRLGIAAGSGTGSA